MLVLANYCALPNTFQIYDFSDFLCLLHENNSTFYLLYITHTDTLSNKFYISYPYFLFSFFLSLSLSQSTYSHGHIFNVIFNAILISRHIFSYISRGMLYKDKSIIVQTIYIHLTVGRYVLIKTMEQDFSIF